MGKYDLFKKINNSSLSTKDRTIIEMQTELSQDFESPPSYCTGLKNNQDAIRFWSLDENTLNKKQGKKRIIMKPLESISLGDLVYVNDWQEYWLCTNKDSADEVYDRGIIERCNNILKVQVDDIEEIIGYDNLGRPIIETTPIYYESQCIATTTLRNSDIYNTDKQVNLPQGYLQVVYSYDDIQIIQDDSEFEMYGKTYKIIEQDMTQVINNNGIVTLLAKKVV